MVGINSLTSFGQQRELNVTATRLNEQNNFLAARFECFGALRGGDGS